MKSLAIVVFMFWLFVITNCPICFAQNDHLRFEPLTTQDGLSHNSVLSIHQDKEGFMWFGTDDGLNRYDGYAFQTFKADPKDLQNTLRSNYIFSIYEDRKGRLWVGSHALHLFNKRTEKFTAYLPDSTKFTYLNIPLSINEDSNGMLWFSAGGGLNRFNPEHETFTSYLSPELTPNLGLVQDHSGIFWMGSSAGLYKFNPNNKALQPFSIESATNQPPVIKALTIDSKGILWIGTAGSGIFRLDTQDTSSRAKAYNPGNLVNRYISNNGIIEDQSGNIWLATTEGLQKIDKNNNKVSTFRADPDIQGSLNSNHINSIYQDKAGTLWIGTDNGINKLINNTQPFLSYQLGKNTQSTRLEENKINSLVADAEGFVWLGTVRGLYQFNPATSQYFHFPLSSPIHEHDATSGGESIVQYISVIKEDQSGRLWVGTSLGLYLINRDGKVTHYPCKIRVQFMDLDHLGQLWIPGLDDKSGNAVMAVFNTNQLKFDYTEYQVNDINGLRDGYMHGVLAGSSGDIWIAAGMRGIGFRDHHSGKFTHLLPNPSSPGSMIENDINCLYEDHIGIIWAGTRMGGLYRLDPKTGSFTNFSTYDGLVSNNISSIIEDDNGRLWLGTNNGLSLFDPENKSFRNFDTNDGLPYNGFGWGAVYKRNGKLYFGTGNGFVVFNPDSIQPSFNIPPVYITSLTVSEQKREIPEDILVLQHFENFLSFEFTALDYNASEKIQYAYKMENFNEDWIHSGKRRNATYTNLDPGKYTFRVKASNNDGEWNEEAASLSILIHPPWWRTTWAYLFYSFLGVCLLYVFRHYTLVRERLKNDLKIKQIEAEKLHELEITRSRFFANISHEFRTPLTLILGPLDQLIVDQEEKKYHSLFLMMERNGRRLLNLINQLLDLSKLESGSLQLEKDTENISRFLKILASSFISLAECRNINFITRYENLNYIVAIDKDKLEKIVINLLSNAFKFTPEGKTIEFITEIKDLNNNAPVLEIIVADTGIGIKKEEKGKIFDRFYQADNSQFRDTEGTGIGLSLTKELVDLHKGTISVTSEPGEGTTFKVSLPVVVVKPILEPTEVPYNEVKNKVSFDNNIDNNKDHFRVIENTEERPILLIIEDNQDLSHFIASQFELQFQIQEAENGKVGFQKALNTVPDLIISDVMMPVMDGIELCKKIKTDVRTSHIPLILLTAKAGDNYKLEGLETGADDYLAKPFKEAELKARVNNLIEGRKRLREKYNREIKLQPEEIAITSADEKFLKQLMTILEANYIEASFNIENIEKETALSRTQFYRKMKALTGQAPGEFLRNFRLQKAAMMLMGKQGNITEIAYAVGFSSLSYFTKCFKEIYGKSPSQYMASKSVSEKP